MGKTLWQMARDWWKGGSGVEAPTFQDISDIYNPLQVQVPVESQSHVLTLDALVYRGISFTVSGVEEFRLTYGGKEFVFSDYHLEQYLTEVHLGPLKLRVYPHDTPGRTLQALILTRFDEINYNGSFKALLDDPQFNITDDYGNVEESFWRIDDVKTPYQAKTTWVGKTNRSSGEVWYWDYWRSTEVTDPDTVTESDSLSYKEFLFIEWDKGDTGRFTLWRGEEVPRSCISV